MAGEGKVEASCGECTICLTPLLMGHGEDTLATTPCGHMFHYLCITQCLEYNSFCPNCKNHLKECEVHKMASMYMVASLGGASPAAGESQEVAVLKKELQLKSKLAEELHEFKSKATQEIARLTAVVDEVREAYAKIRRERARQQGDVARMHQENQTLKAELKDAKAEMASMAILRECAEDYGRIEADVLAADEAVKDKFIRDQFHLLQCEKGRVKEAEARVAELEATNEVLTDKVKRLKEKIKRLVTGGLAEQAEQAIPHHLGAAEQRLARRALKRSSEGQEKVPLDTPTAPQSGESPASSGTAMAGGGMVRRRSSLLRMAPTAKDTTLLEDQLKYTGQKDCFVQKKLKLLKAA